MKQLVDWFFPYTTKYFVQYLNDNNKFMLFKKVVLNAWKTGSARVSFHRHSQGDELWANQGPTAGFEPG